MKIKNMKLRNKRAQHKVITIILIVLLAIVAIVIFWQVIKKVIERGSDTDITGLTVSLEIKSAWVDPDNTQDMRVEVSRGEGKAELTSLIFILTDKDGNTYKGEIIEPSYILKELETRIYQMRDDSVISFSPEIDDFKDIVSVAISFGVTTTGGKTVTHPTQSTMNPTSNPGDNPGTPNPGGPGNGGPGCTPNKECNYYYDLGQCGSSLSNGCTASLSCLECFEGETCFEGTCSDTQGSLDLRGNVLIIYNENSEDALEIAQYYADARGISREQICAVKLPTGQFAEAKYLSGAKKTIIENCICNHISLEPCDIGNINEIAEVSPFTHLAIIRGIPPRLTETGWEYDAEEPSLDYYLSFMIYQDFDIFGEDTDYSDSINNGKFLWANYYGISPDEVDSQSADASKGYIREINPSLDKVLAYGRIEAMTKERTFELIDRTIAAEKKGVSGNFLVGLSDKYTGECLDTPAYNFFREVSSSLNAECEDYLIGGQWPYETCRTGVTYDGEIPGESGSTIDKAIDAGIYLGTEEDNNLHAGFDGFNVMLNWRKTDEDCVPLCEDTADPEACRANSKDYFKEINTDCVGVADGFLGYQIRSYPVQFYGFWPPGWDHLWGGNGADEKTPPVVLSGNAYQDAAFTDDKYLHYGALDTKESPECELEDGSVEDCPEMIGVNLRKRITISPKIFIEDTYNFKVKVRYRNKASPGGKFEVYPILYYDEIDSYGDHRTFFLDQYVDLSDQHDEWATSELDLSINLPNKHINRILLDFRSKLPSAPLGWLELDAVEFIDAQTETLIASFSFDSENYEKTTSGDYAANVIDRLGGIAWWGSASHFLTLGYAFTRANKFAGAFYSGRSLGGSLLHIGNRGMSGIIYGDPLYRPSGVKIYVSNTVELNDVDLGYVFFEDAIDKIYINAFHGQDNFDITNWLLSICYEADREACDAGNSWTEFKSGEGAVFGLEVAEINEITAGLDLNQEQNILMKLRVWNAGEEENDLTNYAYFYYKVDTDEDGLPDDWEIEYFDELSKNAEDDPDDDGYNNLEEFRFDLGGRFDDDRGTTNPLDSGSKPLLCISDRHCASGSYCGEFYECRECLDNTHCGEEYCYRHHCEECFDNGHCGVGYCENFRCVECDDNGDCTDPLLPVCDNGNCVECSAEDTSHCPIDKPDCLDNVCVGCADNDYCKENFDDKPNCLSGECVGCDDEIDPNFCTDNFIGLPYCVDFQCVECLTLSDCPGENFCWLDNSCYSPTCNTASDCEDFDDCSENICNAEGFCEFNKLSEADCYYCADFTTCSDVGEMTICGGVDINHNGVVEKENGQADYDIWSSWFMKECGEFNSFCEYADINRDGYADTFDSSILNPATDKSCNCEAECPGVPTYNAYWRFDTETGGITPDEVEGHDGTLIGDASIVTDTDRGDVLELDGIGDYVEVFGHDFSLHSFSVSAWFKSDTFVDFNRAVVSQDNGNGDGKSWIYIKNDGLGKTISTLIGGGPAKDTGEIANENQWYHVVVTYDWDIDEVKACVDGVEKGSWTSAMEFADGNIFIGRKKANANLWYFDGRIDDVRIYNSALTTEEIEQLYCAQGGTGAVCGIASLGLWGTIADFFKDLFGL